MSAQQQIKLTLKPNKVHKNLVNYFYFKVRNVYSYQWFSISRIIAMRTEKINKIYLLSINFKRWIVYCILYYCTKSAHGNNSDGRQAYARARKGMCKRELTDISLHTSSHSSLHCCTVHRTQQYRVTTISWAFQFWPIISNLLLLEIYNYRFCIWYEFPSVVPNSGYQQSTVLNFQVKL